MRISLFFLAGMMSVGATTACGAQWEQVASLPRPAGNMAVAAIDGRIVAAGGITWEADKKIRLNTIWALEPDAASWKSIGNLPLGWAYAAAAAADNQLFMAGGSDGERMHPELIAVSTDGILKEQSADCGTSVYSAAACIQNKLYVIAGTLDENDLTKLTAGCRQINLLEGTTETMPSYPGGKVMIAAAAAAQGKLYVFGGAESLTSATVQNVNSAFLYDPATRNWRALPDLPVRVRGLAACTLDNTHVLIAGGYTDAFSDQAWIYDIQRNQYTETARLPYPAMTNLVRLGEYVYCIGGEDRMKNRTDRVYRTKWRELLR